MLPLLTNQSVAGPGQYQLAERELTLQEAAGRAQQQYGGKVIKADPVIRDGRNAYRIRLVRPDGRVREIMMDADSGRPLERKRK
ncbi:PepSY domain-containing protein [Marinobacterium arenosum]|uniref:PepSY domain-containing protein n=1 Tax=Marinobacterium arenosum TaxID=2862496 RepID=UPI001C939EA7|nr:PepSY domain-containing protein [Marinobacterium arenosum]MBY4676458.1 PepSY domain-containing protein [Marinobacterium arenosum]